MGFRDQLPNLIDHGSSSIILRRESMKIIICALIRNSNTTTLKLDAFARSYINKGTSFLNWMIDMHSSSGEAQGLMQVAKRRAHTRF